MIDQDGNVYGTTACGGTGNCAFSGGLPGCGTAFKLTNTNGTWKENILYNFTRGDGLGKNPSSGLFFDADGHLDGLSFSGGDGFGTLFSLDNSPKHGWVQDVLYRFQGWEDGRYPHGLLVTGPNGPLYGVTPRGPGDGGDYGSIFELRKTEHGWRKRTLHAFGNRPDGSYPDASPVMDSQGHLFGTTADGGVSNWGTIYEVIP